MFTPRRAAPDDDVRLNAASPTRIWAFRRASPELESGPTTMTRHRCSRETNQEF